VGQCLGEQWLGLPPLTQGTSPSDKRELWLSSTVRRLLAEAAPVTRDRPSTS